jgi:hypothetical protein
MDRVIVETNIVQAQRNHGRSNVGAVTSHAHRILRLVEQRILSSRSVGIQYPTEWTYTILVGVAANGVPCFLGSRLLALSSMRLATTRGDW